jgi:diguanylate cyclase (GGDEF)-like protein/PAS domain S-box-containing protein
MSAAVPARAPEPGDDLIPEPESLWVRFRLFPAAVLAWAGVIVAIVSDDRTHRVAFALVGAGGILTAAFGLVRRAPGRRLAWVPLLVALVLLVAARVVVPAAGHSPTSLAVLAFANGAFALAALTLLQQLRPTRDRAPLLDAGLVFLALTPAWWPSFVNPILETDWGGNFETAARVLLTGAALLVFAVAVQLLAVVSSRGAGHMFLVGGLLLDAGAAIAIGTSATVPAGLSDLAWLAAIYACAFAVSIPEPTIVGAHVARRVERRRLLVLPALTVVGPAAVFGTVALGADTRSSVLLAGGCAIVTFLLVTLRLSGLISVERESGMQRGMERFAALVQHSQDAIFVVDEGGTISYASPSALAFTGCDPASLVGMALPECFPAAEAPRVADHLRRACVGVLGAHLELDGPYVDRNGEPGEYEMTVVNLLGTREVQGLVVTARDVTARRRLERELSRKALRDDLTGLANRTLFMDRLEHALNRLKRVPGTVAVMFLDLDDFKAVNDGLGHSAGDALLVAVAERLHACMRPSDTIARLGGDEFAVLLEEIEDTEAAMQAAHRLLEVLQLPVAIDDFSVNVPASIGVAIATEAAAPESLMRDADIALYRAKGDGKARVAQFDSMMRWAAYERLRVRTELSRAIEQDALRLMYQPIVTLGTDEIRGVEALLRWEHETLGSVPPEEFIPLAEESGLIHAIGRWVLRHACEAAAHWNARVDRDVYVSVNVSAWQLREATFSEQLAEVLEETGLRPSLLMLELTESALVDEAARANLVDRVVPLGVAIAIDDFGTGYSSLAYLQSLPVDVVKIDRQFVSDIAQDGTRAVVESIAAIARVMGFSSIAEGVETDEQLAHLEAFDCRYGQGYRYSQPVDLATLLALLAAGPGWRGLDDDELALRAREIGAGTAVA